ncbi:hypothetical protein [Pseudomonas aeruginosa]|uniref:hypothetical protein n=1 Tax=Pseudomonas aeruginosa TaxID=287 RepID=UPI001ABE4EF0|nr:hypothetical protein [Pseudomonas aeruginosa]MBO3780396.1 hypothetical protein [Pseudomonas aeruginosa]MDP5658048.1 hypothetical protein [Pseudomonas aeruginosa]HBO0245211.1 hypothetical protein [Pseudomonas aeruginosa]HBP1524236.1 hypothetical protein [Pseudomonas aeruginosa]HCF4674994.1 hypothetical protein [Pseudomonas aeruginosa]
MISPMLISQRDDHKRNFFRTRNLADALATTTKVSIPLSTFGPSLLRFYAVESGLKYLLNRIEKVPFSYEVKELNIVPDSTAGFPAKIENYSHNLPRMLSRLKVSAVSVPVPEGPFKVTKGYNGGQEFELSGAHEAWRYGLETDPKDQALLEDFLSRAISYIEAEI